MDDLFSLFDDDEIPDLTPNTNTTHDEALASWAFLYTATEKGNSTGIKFMATIEDAMRWCSSDASKGQYHGTRWSYFYTSVLNFVRHHRGDADTYGEYEYLLELNGLEDNGAWDERIAASGCQMVKLDEIPAVLEPLGVKCVGKPRVTRHSASSRRRAA